jgi:hypothetical protein
MMGRPETGLIFTGTSRTKKKCEEKKKNYFVVSVAVRIPILRHGPWHSGGLQAVIAVSIRSYGRDFVTLAAATLLATMSL